MEEVEVILSNVFAAQNLVENLKELEIAISDDKSNQIKAFVIQKGLIEFCAKQFDNYKTIKRECLSGICSLLISLLMFSEAIKKRIINSGIGNKICEMIHVIHYKDSIMTNLTLNDMLRLTWGLMTIADFNTRRSIVNKRNIKHILASFDRISDEETTVTALNLMAALSIDDFVIPLFISTGMIEQCILLGKKHSHSSIVMMALSVFIANTIFTEEEYKIAKKLELIAFLISLVKQFQQNSDVIESIISAIRSVANSSEEANEEFMKSGIYKELIKVGQGKQQKFQEKMMNFLYVITHKQEIISQLVEFKLIEYVCSVMKQICETNPILDKSKESSLPLLRNTLGVFVNICFSDDQLDNVMKSGILPYFHQCMQLSINDRMSQSTCCSIIQCLAIKEQNGKILNDNGLVEDVVCAFERHLKKKPVAMCAIGASINLSQNSECANELVEEGIIDLLITLNKRFPDKKQLTKKMVTCVMNMLINETVSEKVSEQTLPFIQNILMNYSKEENIVLKCLSCVISLIKSSKATNAILFSLDSMIKNIDLNDKQINNKLIQIICTISSKKELAVAHLNQTSVEFLISNAQRLLSFKDIFLNSVACLLNFSCYNELHSQLLVPSLFNLFSEAANKYENEAKVCSAIANCMKNFSISEPSRKTISNNNFHSTLVRLLSKHVSNEEVFKACVGALWNLSIEPSVSEKMVELNTIQYCKKAIEDTFKTNEQILSVIVGFFSVLSNNSEQAKKQIKTDCFNSLSRINISNDPSKQRLNKLLMMLSS